MTGIWAHRGFSSRAPENTMAAFKLALNYDIQGIETDIHQTVDGKLIITHDPQLGRTLKGNEWIKDLTWEELKNRDCGSWFHRDFNDQKIPLLSELLDLAEPTGICLNLEIKEGGKHYPGLEENLLDLLSHHPMGNRVILSSFELDSLKKCRELSATIPLGVLVKDLTLNPLAMVESLEAQAYHPDYRLLLPMQSRILRKRGIQINPYTVDDPVWMKRMFRKRVNNLITNDPELALNVRKAFMGSS